MKRARYLFQLVGCFSLIAVAPLCRGGEPAAAAKHCLWKLQGQRNSVFLLGSVHFLQKQQYPLAPVIDTAFSNALLVAFETDLAEMESVETQMKLLNSGRLP